MTLDILVREVAQDWMIFQTHFFRFLQRIFHVPAIAQNTPIIEKVATRGADRQ
jgi:hypothetical protein